MFSLWLRGIEGAVGIQRFGDYMILYIHCAGRWESQGSTSSDQDHSGSIFLMVCDEIGSATGRVDGRVITNQDVRASIRESATRILTMQAI